MPLDLLMQMEAPLLAHGEAMKRSNTSGRPNAPPEDRRNDATSRFRHSMWHALSL
jgi:hypothetical protein